MTFVLALTGSIAMGKSTASDVFRAFGLPVFDADAAVHRLFAPHGAARDPVLAAFPGCRDDQGGIDRRSLGRLVYDDPRALARLEGIVHPLVRAEQKRFLARQAAARQPLAVLDIPLLYETGGERLVDAVAVVSAPAFLQARRVLRRPGMTKERFDAILARQIPDRIKCKRADFVIETGLGKRRSIDAIARIVDRVKPKRGTAWPDRWLSAARRRH